MAHVDEDATRVQTALDALDSVSAGNLNEDDFENYKQALRSLDTLEQSLTDRPNCSVDPRDGGDNA